MNVIHVCEKLHDIARFMLESGIIVVRGIQRVTKVVICFGQEVKAPSKNNEAIK